MFKKISSVVLLIFTLGCLYFMSKGLIGITAAYCLITFNIARIFAEMYAAKLIANKLNISDSFKEEIPRKTGHMLISFITGPMIYFSFKGTYHMPLCIGIIYIFVLIATKTGLLNIISRDESSNYNNLESTKYFVFAALVHSIIAYFNPAYLMPMMLGIMALGLGDPMACFMGKKFGKHKIYKNKTLEGFIGFIIGATIAMYIFSHITIWKLLIMAIAGAITELVSEEKDNLNIQFVVAFVAYIILL